MIELMLVMVVMAIIASLATGAAIKAMRQAQEKRILSTCEALRSALTNYRAKESRWPVPLDPGDGETVSFRDDNSRVFAPLLEDSTKVYLDASALYTQIPGRGVLTLREALDGRASPKACSIGYPDPSNTGRFKFFKVTFNVALDTVKVER